MPWSCRIVRVEQREARDANRVDAKDECGRRRLSIRDARSTRLVRLALDVFNLFDRQASGIDYCYASRLKGEPAGGVADIHSHPVEPRSLRLSLTANF